MRDVRRLPRRRLLSGSEAGCGARVRPGRPRIRLTDPSSCRSLLDGAGLRDVAVASERHGYSPSGPDEWWDVVWNSGFRGLLDQLSPEGLEEFKAQHMKEIGVISRKGDLWLNIDLILARGIRAGSEATMSWPCDGDRDVVEL